MNVNDFNYELPESFIAEHPSAKRDESRLMVLNRQAGSIEHRHFYDLPDYLNPGDVLVFNDSKVIPARLIGSKRDTGAHIELLLVHPAHGHDVSAFEWIAMAKPARRLKSGSIIDFEQNLSAEVLEKFADGTLHVRFISANPLLPLLDQLGSIPLPPYIKRAAEADDTSRYQTVYANAPGSVAAPTAGLHFTHRLIEQVEEQGIETAHVTLQVGMGTFKPVQTETIEEHVMHEEWFCITPEVAAQLKRALCEGRRIVCVGTTSVRTLESAAMYDAQGQLEIQSGWHKTSIFIYPGYHFKVVDALITNFHLPNSTLLMLVSAFYQREQVLDAYNLAVRENYRFFSYGDAMLII